jgi:hypothetical protein
MNSELIQRLDAAIQRRNPLLATRLRPGIPEDRIKKMLLRKGIQGFIDPIIEIYRWKNGSDLDSSVSKLEASPFPGSEFIFMDLEFMLRHFQMHKTWANYQPGFKDVAGRYFPLFWNGSVSWLAIDLKPLEAGRLVIIAKRSEELVCQAYDSFQEFLQDAVSANENNVRLKALHVPHGAS